MKKEMTERRGAGIPRAGFEENLADWLENPSWREYYETAPSERCRTLIALEFWYSGYESEDALRQIEAIEETLDIADWEHLFRWCGNNPRKKAIHDRIRRLEDSGS